MESSLKEWLVSTLCRDKGLEGSLRLQKGNAFLFLGHLGPGVLGLHGCSRIVRRRIGPPGGRRGRSCLHQKPPRLCLRPLRMRTFLCVASLKVLFVVSFTQAVKRIVAPLSCTIVDKGMDDV